MANSFLPVLASGSTQGIPTKVVQTASAGTVLHTTGVSATIIDEIAVYASNIHTTEVVLTLECGAATSTQVITIPSKAGRYYVGTFRLAGSGAAGALLAAFAATANVIFCDCHVTRYTP